MSINLDKNREQTTSSRKSVSPLLMGFLGGCIPATLALFIVLGGTSGNEAPSTETTETITETVQDNLLIQENKAPDKTSVSENTTPPELSVGDVMLGETFLMEGIRGPMEITLGNQLSFSSIDGDEYVKMPITFKNISGESSYFTNGSFDLYGPDGVAIDWKSRVAEDDITSLPHVRNGVVQEGFLYIPYRGNGEYVFEAAWGEDLEIYFLVEHS